MRPLLIPPIRRIHLRSGPSELTCNRRKLVRIGPAILSLNATLINEFKDNGQTGGGTLEDAFIALTGHSIDEAEATPIDRVGLMRRVWHGRR
jgi:hypothetical protein